MAVPRVSPRLLRPGKAAALWECERLSAWKQMLVGTADMGQMYTHAARRTRRALSHQRMLPCRWPSHLQGHVISFDPAHSPANASSVPLPELNISGISYAWAGALAATLSFPVAASGCTTSRGALVPLSPPRVGLPACLPVRLPPHMSTHRCCRLLQVRKDGTLAPRCATRRLPSAPRARWKPAPTCSGPGLTAAPCRWRYGRPGRTARRLRSRTWRRGCGRCRRRGP